VGDFRQSPILPQPKHFEVSLVNSTCRAPETACWLRLGCWSNNSANSRPSPGAFNRRVLRFCLVSQCSYPPYRPRHQRRLANCDWIPASILAGIQPTELHRTGTTLSLARRAMEPGHLLHSAATGTNGCLDSRHPFVRDTHLYPETPICRDTHLYPTHNISSVHLTTTTYRYVRRTGRITNGMWSGRTAPQDSAFFIPDTGTHSGVYPPKRSLCPA